MKAFAKHIKMAIESQEIANSGEVTLVDIPEVNEVAASEDTPEMLQAAQDEFDGCVNDIEKVSDDIVQAQTDVKLIEAGIDLIGVADEKNEMFDIQVTAVEALARICRLAQERYAVSVKCPAVESLKGKDAVKAIRAFAKEAEDTKSGVTAKIKAAVEWVINKIKEFVKFMSNVINNTTQRIKDAAAAIKDKATQERVSNKLKAEEVKLPIFNSGKFKAKMDKMRARLADRNAPAEATDIQEVVEVQDVNDVHGLSGILASLSQMQQELAAEKKAFEQMDKEFAAKGATEEAAESVKPASDAMSFIGKMQKAVSDAAAKIDKLVKGAPAEAPAA